VFLYLQHEPPFLFLWETESLRGSTLSLDLSYIPAIAYIILNDFVEEHVNIFKPEFYSMKFVSTKSKKNVTLCFISHESKEDI
jgi:hypothetical protein